METTDYAKSIKSIQRVAVIAIAVFALMFLIMLIMYLVEKNSKAERIYVSTDIGTFTVKRGDLNQRQAWEIKNSVKTAIGDLFENDILTYNKNIETALNLVDNQMGLKIKDLLNKSGLYDILRKENAYTKVIFDSVIVKQMSQPYEVRAYFKQIVMWRGMNQVIPYGVLMTVTEDSRNEKNPYGLLINRFDLIKYDPKVNIAAIKADPDSLKGSR